VGVRNLAAIGDVRTDRRERLRDLPGHPLTADELEVASAHVVDDRVAGDIVQGLFPRHEARGAADDHAELDLPVELLRATGSQDRLARIDDCVRPLGKDRRLLGNGLIGLFRVVAVVEPDADEFPGIIDRRVQARRRGGHRHPFLDAGDRVFRGGAALEERAGAGRHQRRRNLAGAQDAATRQGSGEARLEIGDPIPLNCAQTGFSTVGGEAYELHG